MSPENQPVIVPVQAPSGGRSGCLLVLSVLLALALAVSLLVNLALAARGAGMGPKKPEPMTQKWVAGDGDAKVALIELQGVIMDEVQSGGLFGVTTQPIERIRRELEEAEKDETVKAVLFEVDSPGGSVTASDEIWNLFRRFKERSKKPVVVFMGGICASGGYYVSAPADVIYASPTTITGSIGVIMSAVNFRGLLDKFDVKPLTIKAGANKDLLNPTEPIREEHVRIIQDMIDEAYNLFVSRIVAGRAKAGLSEPAIRDLADGRIYTAEQALKLKLVDKIGYRDDAFEEARKLGGVTQATLFRYSKFPSFLEALAGDAEAAASGELAGRRVGAGGPLSIETVLSLETPRLMYLWAPFAGGN